MGESLKSFFNRGSLPTLISALKAIAFGDVLRSLPVTIARKAFIAAGPATLAPYDLAAVCVHVLPDNAKASVLHRAYARVASGGVGEAAVQAYGTTPSTGQAAITPCGNIAYVLADLPTVADLQYTPAKGEVIELTAAVASNALALPSYITARGVIYLLEAEGLVGTATGKKIVLVPSGSAAAAGQARLDLAKVNVKFNGTDAITSARVKLLVAYEDARDVSALLEADANLI